MKGSASLVLVILVLSWSAFAQTNAFTYQGRLTDTTLPANGTYDFQFGLRDSEGVQRGPTVTITGVNVAAGIFKVELDFGSSPSPFVVWANLELEIRVKQPAQGTYTTLDPRQRITSAPYSITASYAISADTANHATTATTATNVTNFTGFLSGNVSGQQGATVVNMVAGQTAANVANAAIAVSTATSANTPNTLVKRDANGDLSANTINAATQYNIGGNRVFSAPGNFNFNTFAGADAGTLNTGFNNSFFGRSAGMNNTVGYGNSFFGTLAGYLNAGGVQNSFFGDGAGRDNTNGLYNSFFGNSAGVLNTTGSNNTMIGFLANVTAVDLTNATAIGANAVVSQSNSLVLGNNSNVGIGTSSPREKLDVVGNGVFTGNVGIGVSAPSYKLHVNDSQNTGLRVENISPGGTIASFGGTGVFQIDYPNVPGGRLKVTEDRLVSIPLPSGLIVRSPDNACWAINVSTTGVLSTTSVPCP